MHSQRRFSLSLKLNLLIVFIILVVAGGLVLISYRIYCERVNEQYISRVEHAARVVKEEIIPEYAAYFWEHINTDEFREISARAIEENNEELIRDWLISKPSGFFMLSSMDVLTETSDIEDHIDRIKANNQENLYEDYRMMQDVLSGTRDLFDVSSVYLQRDIDGITYNLADPDENLLYVGTTEKPIEAFGNHQNNEYFPPIIYKSDFGWLCTVLIPLEPTMDGEIVGYAGVDTDMNMVVKQQRMYLVHSSIYVLALTTAAILLTMYLVNRIAVHPLKELSQAAAVFAASGEKLTMDDVTELPIHSNDEIGDLYQQLRVMQTRIIRYTEHMTRITKEKERAGTELHMAKSIQKSMLPGDFPAFPERNEFDLYASMTPAKEVGGDFYDFFLMDDEHLAVLIADVSDKGVPAALFMMSSKILINYRAHQGGTPAEILTDVNVQLCQNNSSKMFVTVWMGILDLNTGVMTCTNAGHEYPFIRTADGSFSVFKDKHGLVLGALPKTKYRDYELKLEPGDAVFVYTDGIPEANNASGEFYGMDRLETALNRVSKERPQAILEEIRADVDRFAGSTRQFDDLTMLCLEYKHPRG